MEGHHNGKRALDGQEEAYVKRAKVDDSLVGPSKVLHVRNVDPAGSQAYLHAFVSQFGAVVSICFLSKFQQALVEMESVEAASSVIMYTKQTPFYINGKEAHFAFSKSTSINSTQITRPGQVETPPGSIHNILLCTIQNPSIFSITVDVMYAIMSPYGPISRIVVFTKHALGPQVLVEFENSVNAATAKAGLEGKDIYSGACTLKIEFSKSQKLNVRVNNELQRDYTNTSLPTQQAYSSAPAHQMGGGPMGGYQQAYNDYYRMYGGMQGMPPPPPVPEPVAPSNRTVLIAYGFDPAFMSTEKVFNLFCLYGNVSKIKPLNANKGTLVQMGDNQGADNAINFLHGLVLFGQTLNIQHSKHPYIADSRRELTADGVPAAPTSSDFTSSPLNRFRNPNGSKHVYKPTTVLYFSNAPEEFTEQSWTELFNKYGATPPSQIRFFNLTPREGVRDSAKKLGLLEFPSITAAAEALVFANNEKIEGHTLRLAFSNNTINQGPGGQQMQGGQDQMQGQPQQQQQQQGGQQMMPPGAEYGYSQDM